MGHGERSHKREIHSITDLPQEASKISNNLILHLKELEKEKQTKPEMSSREKIIKIRVEIHEIELQSNTNDQ